MHQKIKIIDNLAEFRADDPNQLDLFHYLDDPIINGEKLPKLNKNEINSNKDNIDKANRDGK